MRRALRLATGAQHQQLDKLIGRPRDLGAYKRYLAFNAVFRPAVERALSAPGHLTALQPFRISSDLALDCRDLDVTPFALSSPSVSIAVSKAAHLGALYVLEGAALGARLLLRDAEELGLDGARGARHLARLVLQGARWETFLETLESIQASDEEALTDSARKVFAFALGVAGSILHAERV
jgi:heme oxygenase